MAEKTKVAALTEILDALSAADLRRLLHGLPHGDQVVDGLSPNQGARHLSSDAAVLLQKRRMTKEPLFAALRDELPYMEAQIITVAGLYGVTLTPSPTDQTRQREQPESDDRPGEQRPAERIVITNSTITGSVIGSGAQGNGSTRIGDGNQNIAGVGQGAQVGDVRQSTAPPPAAPSAAAPVQASSSAPPGTPAAAPPSAPPARAPAPADPLLGDLRQQLDAGRVLFIVGAGVSLGATGGAAVAGWGGLLEHGVAHCEALSGETAWAAAMRSVLALKQTSLLITVAEQITEKLGGPGGGQYRRWLRETVGSLRITDASTLEALKGLGCRLATTNYDHLLSEITGLAPISWDEAFEVEAWLRGEEPGILHLHGQYKRPASVILGAKSYWEIGKNDRVQTVQRALQMNYTLVFVGCGAGLEDPNVGAMLGWATANLKGTGARHYRLCRDGEVGAVREQHKGSDIYPIPYGPKHSDLPAFLNRLREPQTSEPD